MLIFPAEGRLWPRGRPPGSASDDSSRDNIYEACAELLVNLNYLLVVVDADKKLLKLASCNNTVMNCSNREYYDKIYNC